MKSDNYFDLMFISKLFYSNSPLFWVHILNIYHLMQIPIISLVRRYISPKNSNFFCYIPDNERKIDILRWTPSSTYNIKFLFCIVLHLKLECCYNIYFICQIKYSFTRKHVYYGNMMLVSWHSFIPSCILVVLTPK